MSQETTHATRKCEKSSTTIPMHAGAQENAKNAYFLLDGSSAIAAQLTYIFLTH
jgi:hypothetical protein